MKIKKICILILSLLVTLYAQNKNSIPTITIHAVESSLPNVLSILADESGFNIVTGPKVNSSEKITIHLEDVPIDQAIDMVVRASGLSYEIVGNSILVAKAERLNSDVGTVPHIISLKYANAGEVASLLRNITDKITLDKSGNNLLVNASPKKIAEIQSIINEVDKNTDVIVLLFNSNEQDLQKLYNKNIPVDFILRSQGRTRSSDGGSKIPTYVAGDRGKLLYKFEFEIVDKELPLTDMAWCTETSKRMEDRLNKMKKGDISVNLYELYKSDQATLNRIENYQMKLEEVNYRFENAINRINFRLILLVIKIVKKTKHF